MQINLGNMPRVGVGEPVKLKPPAPPEVLYFSFNPYPKEGLHYGEYLFQLEYVYVSGRGFDMYHRQGITGYCLSLVFFVTFLVFMSYG